MLWDALRTRMHSEEERVYAVSYTPLLIYAWAHTSYASMKLILQYVYNILGRGRR